MNIIQDMVGERFVEVLTKCCITDVAEADYKAIEVKQGLFQDDPVKKRIVLSINPGNIDDTSTNPRWQTSNSQANDEIISAPPYELGGGGFIILRYTIDVNVFLVKTQESQNKARNIGLFHFAAITKALDNMPLGITDDLGYCALLSFVKSSDPYETGGPGSYIWKGKVFVEAFVSKP